MEEADGQELHDGFLHPRSQGSGVGRGLLPAAERQVHARWVLRRWRPWCAVGASPELRPACSRRRHPRGGARRRGAAVGARGHLTSAPPPPYFVRAVHVVYRREPHPRERICSGDEVHPAVGVGREARARCPVVKLTRLPESVREALGLASKEPWVRRTIAMVPVPAMGGGLRSQSEVCPSQIKHGPFWFFSRAVLTC